MNTRQIALVGTLLVVLSLFSAMAVSNNVETDATTPVIEVSTVEDLGSVVEGTVTIQTGSYKLVNAVDASSVNFVLAGDVILDLNGFELKIIGTNTTQSFAKLTIKDGSNGGAGIFHSYPDAGTIDSGAKYNLLLESGTLKVEGRYTLFDGFQYDFVGGKFAGPDSKLFVVAGSAIINLGDVQLENFIQISSWTSKKFSGTVNIGTEKGSPAIDAPISVSDSNFDGGQVIWNSLKTSSANVITSLTNDLTVYLSDVDLSTSNLTNRMTLVYDAESKLPQSNTSATIILKGKEVIDAILSSNDVGAVDEDSTLTLTPTETEGKYDAIATGSFTPTGTSTINSYASFTFAADSTLVAGAELVLDSDTVLIKGSVGASEYSITISSTETGKIGEAGIIGDFTISDGVTMKIGSDKDGKVMVSGTLTIMKGGKLYTQGPDDFVEFISSESTALIQVTGDSGSITCAHNGAYVYDDEGNLITDPGMTYTLNTNATVNLPEYFIETDRVEVGEEMELTVKQLVVRSGMTVQNKGTISVDNDSGALVIQNYEEGSPGTHGIVSIGDNAGIIVPSGGTLIAGVNGDLTVEGATHQMLISGVSVMYGGKLYGIDISNGEYAGSLYLVGNESSSAIQLSEDAMLTSEMNLMASDYILIGNATLNSDVIDWETFFIPYDTMTVDVGESGSAVLTLGSDLYIPQYANLCFLNGATAEASDSEKITVAGTIDIYDATMKGLVSVEETGTMYLRGVEIDVDTPVVTEEEVTDDSFDDSEQIIVSGSKNVNVSKNTVIINDTSNLESVTVSGTAVVYIQDDIVDGSVLISNGDSAANSGSIVIKNLSGAVMITYGSVVISSAGDESFAGDIEEIEGKVKISGTIDDDLTLKLKVGKSASVDIQDLTIAAGKKLILDGNSGTGDNVLKAFISDESKVVLLASDDHTSAGQILVTNAAQLSVSGKVEGQYGNIDVDVNSKMFIDTGAVVACSITGEGEIYTEDALIPVELGKDIVSNFDATAQQKVIVVNNITIYSGASLNVAGYLVIPEGIRLTIEDGASLNVVGPTAKADIAGEIVVKGARGLTFDGTEFNLMGGIIVKAENIQENELYEITAIEVKTTKAREPSGMHIYGTLTINSKAYVLMDNMTIEETGTVTINGKAATSLTTNLDNYGTVVIKGISSAILPLTINQQNGAVVTIQSVYGSVGITDEDMYLTTIDKVPQTVKSHPALINQTAGKDYELFANSLVFTDAKGLVIESELKTKMVTIDNEDVRIYTNYMEISGTLTMDKKAVLPSLWIVEGTVNVNDDLDIGVVPLSIDGTLIVNGNVTSSESTLTSGIDGEGTITVYGMVKLRETIDDSDGLKINAVFYETTREPVTYYIYTNLHDAIESGYTDLTVYGKLYVTVDTTVPAGIDLECQNGAEVSKDVEFIIADGADVTITGQTDVYGTFEILNRDHVSHGSVISDIYSYTETTERYTNIATALSKAQAGEEIRLTKTNSNVILSENAEIKSGVTLVVPVNRTLEIAAGVTLTVNGTLNLNNGTLFAGVVKNTLDEHYAAEVLAGEGIWATAPTFKVNATLTNQFSCIKIGDGEIISTEKLTFADYKIAGAYYDIKNKSYITTIEQSAMEIQKATDNKVEVYGDVSAGSVMFLGTTSNDVEIDFKYTSIAGFWSTTSEDKDFKAGSLSDGDLEVYYGKFVFDNNYVITGELASDSGAIKLKKTVSGGFNFGDYELDDEYVAYMKGTVDTITVSDGTVYVLAGAGNSMTATKTDGTTKYKFVVDSDAAVAVYGTLNISGCDTTIDGTVTVAKNAILNAGEKNVTILGALNIVAGGSVTVNYLYIGTAPSTTTSGASVTGPEVSDFAAIILYPGSYVDPQIIDGLKKTEYTVEGQLYATAYVEADSDVRVGALIQAANSTATKTDGIQINNGWAQYWQIADGTDATNNKVSAEKNVSLYVKYEIYNVVILTEQGVDSIYFNGHLMTATATENKKVAFTLAEPVTAGVYKISWQLANGYSDENAALFIKGEKASSFQVSVNGVDIDTTGAYAPATVVKTYDLVLQGIEKSGYVPPEPEPTPEEKSEWTVTTILLCVLVVLIAIMAVIVALRLNRN